MHPVNCPKCNSENIYPDGNLWICPECFHEWSFDDDSLGSVESIEESNHVKDANGIELKDGDSVSVIKDLKVKGAASVLKVGTKVKNIRIIDGEDGHNISCKIEGFGSMNLKSEFVKKIN
ncbi:MAG: zinc ribbon domain-containing protein YjdM [Oligoflexia bacterium]|nr:zinc ribbon domain-containing protein YjdM [Oligoflexia bacterium]